MLILQISPRVFTLFDAIELLSSIVSLVLSIVAIALAMIHKRDADTVNAKTSEVLVELRSATQAIVSGVMAELHSYGEAMRGSFSSNQIVGNRPIDPTIVEPIARPRKSEVLKSDPSTEQK